MESKFGCLTIPELKDELKKRNARVSGRKSELVDRLVSYERNKNFGQQDVTEPEFYMTTPASDRFIDLNSDSKFSGLQKEKVVVFLAKYDKELESHIQSLYREKFLRFVRYAMEDDCIYVKASCHAEMKKGVCYTIDIRLDSTNYTVLETQCECAAGMGPSAHCKHISVVLFGLMMFCKNRSITSEETCTQKLQTFHKTKKFIGSPVKAESLNLPGANELTNINFDPRPEHFRNLPSYQDFFRNACLNFPGISETPIFQTFEPANNLAVAHDHDYFQLTHEDKVLEMLQISTISSDQAKTLQEKTIGQSANRIWKTERTKRLPSSMFGRICKATDRTNKTELAKSLCEIKDIKAPAIDHGRKHESIALQRFSNDTGYVVNPCGLFVCQASPFLAASPDGVINGDHIVEVKCPFTARDKDISTVSVPYLNLNQINELQLDESHEYYYQIQGQLLCTGASKCTFIVCTADSLKVKDIKYIDICRNDQFILKMTKDLSLFYNEHFKNALLNKHLYKPY